MGENKNPAKDRCFDYPAVTEGTNGAAEARLRTNNLPEEKIEELYELAKTISYGGNAKPKVGARHKHSSGPGRGA
jgi:hypothetical protein